MRVFVTGASGFIGTAVVQELIRAGHGVLGMTRSEAGARTLGELGAEPYRGDLDDLDSLRRGAAAADGVIHLAFNHDFSNFVNSCAADGRVIEALGSALIGSDRPLVITSGTGLGGPELPTREVRFDAHHPNPRIASELAGQTVAERGVNVSVVRLPQVHDTVKQGLITPYIELTRAKGAAAYLGDGQTRWPAAHVSDVARLYRLVIERAEPNSRYHAVAEEGIAVKAIAEVIGQGLNVPVVSLSPAAAADHFGWLQMFMGMDMLASNRLTREKLGWNPTGPDLLTDLRTMRYR